MAIFKSPIWAWGRWFLLGFLALRVIFWLITFPNPDEAYYWLWGQQPGFSYYDHPPWHAWVQGLGAAVGGRSTLMLRLPNLLSSGILAFTYYHICRYLYGQDGPDRFWLVLLLLASSPLFFWYLALAWNDHWLVTFAVISGFWFVRFGDGYRQTGRGETGYLYGAALALGLAGLCKYNAVFVGLGFLGTILADGRLRSLLRDIRLYLALALVALVLSPILLWNLQHDFFSFRFYADRTAGGGSFNLNLLQPVVFLALCALILGPIQSWCLGRFLRRGAASAKLARPSCYPAVALWIFGLSTLVFTGLSAVSVALYYWNILAYPLLFPLLTEAFYRPNALPVKTSSTTPGLIRPRLLAITQGIGLFVASALIFHYTVVPITAWVGVDPDSAALYGWNQIAAWVDAEAADLDQPLLLTTDYRSASALAYSLNNPDVMAISGRLDQFDFWYDSATLAGRDGVLLGESWHPICPTHLAMFERTDPPQTLEVRRFGQVLQTYELVRGYSFKAGPEGYPLRPDYPLGFTSDGQQCLSE
ncbi:MAG: ArnT family glycosyltransferase [Nodosilinea sp.]